jgi:hypothetical protein
MVEGVRIGCPPRPPGLVAAKCNAGVERVKLFVVKEGRGW